MSDSSATSRAIDLIISASWVLPIVPENKIFTDCSVAINNGEIIGIYPTDEIVERFNAREVVELDQQVLMPGLINAHGHAAMSLLRSFADDLPLMEWLEKHIWPAEGQHVDEAFVHDGVNLAMAEMLLSGTTCFSDMYFFPEVTAEAANHLGMRAQITFPILDFPTAWAQDADEYISKGLALHDNYRSNDLITIGFGPHAPYTVSNAPFKRIATLAEELQAPVQVHLHETAFEVEQSMQDHGQRPIQRLEEQGVLTPLTQCVHMTQINERDIESLQETGASVVHCPESNLKLASGICPVQKLLDANITVALGTDGAASNNDLDLFGEMKTAALIAKNYAGNASAVDAHTALRMATLNGAKAMNKENQLGSIEAGKQADLIAIDLNEITAQPHYDIASLLVYTQRSHAVKHSWINGKHIMVDREIPGLNLSELKDKIGHWQERISEK